ncbi:hypothetical protein [Devosia sp.]|uniref:hypothetical protein n=1 Tax=Devosia sp. TaxID=1871048 RepID=UPI0035B22402
MTPDEREPALSRELSGRIVACHRSLLERFATARPNELRGEIRRFRQLLRELADWSGQRPHLWQLAQRARWWEWNWCEREFGDSQFAPFAAPRDAVAQWRFNRSHVALIGAMLPIEDLQRELVDLAVGQRIDLPVLGFLAKPNPDDFPDPADYADLLDLRYLLSEATPTLARQLRGMVATVVTSVPPRDLVPRFLDLLSDLDRSFAVAWQSAPLSLEVRRRTGGAVLLQGEVAGGRAASWVQVQQVRLAEAADVELELSSPIDDLVGWLGERSATP